MLLLVVLILGSILLLLVFMLSLRLHLLGLLRLLLCVCSGGRCISLPNDAATEDVFFQLPSRYVLSHPGCFDGFPDDGVLAAEVLHELVLREFLGWWYGIIWRFDNSYIIDRAPGRISEGVGLAVDEFSKRVELGANVLTVCATDIAKLVEGEAPVFAIRVGPRLTCDGSLDHCRIF